MKHKPHTPPPVDRAQPYVMGIADKLSDDPMLLQLLGPRFKVIVDYDPSARDGLNKPASDAAYSN